MNGFERNIYYVLERKYSHPEWVLLSQVKSNTGIIMNYGGERYIDFFIMNMYPSKNHKCISIEVKQSIADLKKRLERPTQTNLRTILF